MKILLSYTSGDEQVLEDVQTLDALGEFVVFVFDDDSARAIAARELDGFVIEQIPAKGKRPLNG